MKFQASSGSLGQIDSTTSMYISGLEKAKTIAVLKHGSVFAHAIFRGEFRLLVYPNTGA